MARCQGCNSERVLEVMGKCSDMCHITYPKGHIHSGYVPRDLNIGGGDYLQFSYCADCGRIQGDFPIEEPEDL